MHRQTNEDLSGDGMRREDINIKIMMKLYEKKNLKIFNQKDVMAGSVDLLSLVTRLKVHNGIQAYRKQKYL